MNLYVKNTVLTITNQRFLLKFSLEIKRIGEPDKVFQRSYQYV